MDARERVRAYSPGMPDARLVIPLLCCALLSGHPGPAVAAPAAPHGEWQAVAPPADSTAERAAPRADHGSVTADAGSPLLRGWSWGWRGGAGATVFTKSLEDSSDGSFVSFDVGLFATRRIGRLSIEPQAIVAVRGGNFVDPFFGTVYDNFGNSYVRKIGEFRGTLSLVELRTPLVARLELGPWTVTPHVLGGVVPALLVYGDYSGNRYVHDFFAGNLSRANLGWTAGAGAAFPMRYGRLTIDLRYEQSGGSVFKSGRGLPGQERAWIVGFGLQMKKRAPAERRPARPHAGSGPFPR